MTFLLEADVFEVAVGCSLAFSKQKMGGST
jgi:hypothetical protein